MLEENIQSNTNAILNELVELAEKYPNDYDLGRKVRKLIFEIKELKTNAEITKR